MIADRLDDFAPAVDQIDHTGRQIALLEQLEHPLLRQRHLFRRLEDERVAADHRERQEPERHHGGKVERRDRGTHANRLPHRDAVDAAGNVLEPVAHEHRRRAARDLDALDAAAQASARLVQRLAVFGRDDARDLVEVLLEKLLELEHRLRAFDRRRVAPAGKRLGGGGHGRVDVGFPGERCAGDDLAACRIVHGDKRGGRRRRPLAPDEMWKEFGLCCHDQPTI